MGLGCGLIPRSHKNFMITEIAKGALFGCNSDSVYSRISAQIVRAVSYFVRDQTKLRVVLSIVARNPL